MITLRPDKSNCFFSKNSLFRGIYNKDKSFLKVKGWCSIFSSLFTNLVFLVNGLIWFSNVGARIRRSPHLSKCFDAINNVHILT